MTAKAKDVKDWIGRSTMFFAGLILLIPHRIGMSRVNYVIKRYNLPISRAGLLLYKYHNNIELSLLCGTLPGNIIVWCIGWKLASTSNQRFQNNLKGTLKWCMFGFLSLMLFSSIYMFIIYISGGDFGHLNAFYFTLILLTIFDGFANAFAFALNGANSSFLAAGIPLSGLLVTLLHYVYKFFSDLFHWDDFDYYVLRLQLICNNIQLIVTCLLWLFFDESKSNPSSFDLAPLFGLKELTNVNGSPDWKYQHEGDWSPIGMLAISLGTVYAFYPSISPYSIIDFQYASIIELWILVISALLPLSFAILDLYSKFNPDGNAIGPSGHYIAAYSQSTAINTSDCTNFGANLIPTNLIKAIKQNWVYNPDTNPDRWWWQLVWISAIFYILCIQIFMSLLHYPHCLLSCFFNNKYLIGFISILFNTLRELMQACGFAGAGKQVRKPTQHTVTKQTCSGNSGTHSAGCKMVVYKWNSDPDNSTQSTTKADDQHDVNGSIAATNKLITLFVMMFCVFTGDGYLQHYRRCCRDCWPTTGYTKYQSFFYWLRFGFKGGIKSITSSFTDLYYHNLRPQFISYAWGGWFLLLFVLMFSFVLCIIASYIAHYNLNCNKLI